MNSSALCTANDQCADYNLVSCPLSGNWPTLSPTCDCATTKYWVCFHKDLIYFIDILLERYDMSRPSALWSAMHTLAS